MDPDDINPDGENNTTPAASCPSTKRPNSPQNNLNKSRLIKLARFATNVYKKELRAKNADAAPATIKRLLTKNNTPLNLTNPNKYHSRRITVSPNSSLPHSFNIPANFNDISSNSNGKIKINRIPSKYGFQDIVTKSIEVQKSPSHVYMDFLQPIPSLNFWLPLQKNITAHDEKMPDFKPYFGDDDTEGNNEHFYQELETINDDDKIVERARERVIPVGERKLLLYRLLAQNKDLSVLEAMQVLVFINDSEEFDFEVEEMDANMCDEDESLSRTEKMVKRFFIVHSMKKWQDRAIAHGITRARLENEQKSYTDSQIKLHTTKTVQSLKSLNLSEKSIKTFCHRSTVSKPPKMLLSTYHDLFCLICHKYDCLTHLNGKPLSTQFKHRVKWSDILTKPNPEACGNSCCMKLKNAGSFFENLEIIRKRMKSVEFDGMNSVVELQEFLSRTIEPEVKISRDGVDKENIPVLEVQDTIVNNFVISKPDLEQVMENWSESSISQFRNLKRIYKNNICELSYLLNKSCEETLYFNILNQITELPKIYGKNISKPENSNHNTEPSQTKLGKKKSKGKTQNKKQLDQMKKSMNNKRQKNKDNQRMAYRPCDACTSENHVCCDTCPCFEVGNYCENSCTCAKSCPNRFGGCNCKGKCESNQCPCYMANRECDPDLCGCEMNFSKLPNDNKICKNNQIQRGLKVQIVMAPSCIAGWGGYSSEVIMPGTLVSEYCGEILTRHASEVRGRIYDKGGCSFVFNLNNEYDVDAMRKGNKVRFVNCSESNPNCEAKVMRVNGEDRIGIYAIKRIKKGQELFFNYGYSDAQRETYCRFEFVNGERIKRSERDIEQSARKKAKNDS